MGTRPVAVFDGETSEGGSNTGGGAPVYYRHEAGFLAPMARRRAHAG